MRKNVRISRMPACAPCLGDARESYVARWATPPTKFNPVLRFSVWDGRGAYG